MHRHHHRLITVQRAQRGGIAGAKQHPIFKRCRQIPLLPQMSAEVSGMADVDMAQGQFMDQILARGDNLEGKRFHFRR